MRVGRLGEAEGLQLRLLVEVELGLGLRMWVPVVDLLGTEGVGGGVGVPENDAEGGERVQLVVRDPAVAVVRDPE